MNIKNCRLKSAKEIWDSLKINYKGNEDVQLRKLQPSYANTSL